jgi:hypothetical protein
VFRREPCSQRYDEAAVPATFRNTPLMKWVRHHCNYEKLSISYHCGN